MFKSSHLNHVFADRLSHSKVHFHLQNSEYPFESANSTRGAANPASEAAKSAREAAKPACGSTNHTSESAKSTL